MHVHRGFLNWGVFLICLGAVPLAVQLNVIDSATASSLLRLWPLILIGIGLGLILRFSRAQALGGFIVAGTIGILVGTFFAAGFPSFSAACTGTQPNGTPLTRNGTVTGGLNLDAEFSCADVSISRPAQTTPTAGAWSVSASAGNETPTIESSGSLLRLKSVTGPRWPFTSDQHELWQVVLPTDATLSANLTVNAAKINASLGNGPIGSLNMTYNASDGWLDLTGAPSASLDATLNASTLGLLLPSGSFSANVNINASTLRVCAAPEVGLRITYDDTLSSQNFAAVGLAQSGKTWQSANYTTATAKADLHITANVSTTTLNPTGGCQ